MNQNLKDQIIVLSNLPDELLTETAKELGDMFQFKTPRWSPGLTKKEFATCVIIEVEKAVIKIPPSEIQNKAAEIVSINEKANPGMFSKILTIIGLTHSLDRSKN